MSRKKAFKDSLIVKIVCIVLAFLMVASIILAVIFGLGDFIVGLFK